MFSNGVSLADIAAVTDRDNNGGGWGGDGWWVLIILFALFGWGGNGSWGGGGNAGTQGALTRGDLCMDMNFNDVQNGVRSLANDVAIGFANLNSTICNQQYDTARMINASDTATAAGFNAMNISNLQGFNALQAQLAQCCCDTRAAIADTNYNMAQNTCAITNQIQNSTRDIVDATNAGTQAILSQMCADKISTLETENAALRLSASQSAQNQYLISQLRPQPEPAFIVPNPFTGQSGYGYGFGCGCGCGC